MHNAGRLIVHDREMHLELQRSVAIGDTFEAVRGNGLREGESMGTATVTGFDDAGLPVLDVRFGAGEREEHG